MGVMKTLDIELQDLDCEADLTNSEDIFDLVVDTHLSSTPLSNLMLRYIANQIVEYPEMRWLLLNDEFMTCWDWHAASHG